MSGLVTAKVMQNFSHAHCIDEASAVVKSDRTRALLLLVGLATAATAADRIMGPTSGHGKELMSSLGA